jgi:hypothetical protein
MNVTLQLHSLHILLAIENVGPSAKPAPPRRVIMVMLNPALTESDYTLVILLDVYNISLLCVVANGTRFPTTYSADWSDFLCIQHEDSFEYVLGPNVAFWLTQEDAGIVTEFQCLIKEWQAETVQIVMNLMNEVTPSGTSFTIEEALVIETSACSSPPAEDMSSTNTYDVNNTAIQHFDDIGINGLQSNSPPSVKSPSSVPIATIATITTTAKPIALPVHESLPTVIAPAVTITQEVLETVLPPTSRNLKGKGKATRKTSISKVASRPLYHKDQSGLCDPPSAPPISFTSEIYSALDNWSPVIRMPVAKGTDWDGSQLVDLGTLPPTEKLLEELNQRQTHGQLRQDILNAGIFQFDDLSFFPEIKERLENAGMATPRRPDVAAILKYHEDTLCDEYDCKDIFDITPERF